MTPCEKSFFEAPIAQLVEHFISNEEVFGSIPNGSSFLMKNYFCGSLSIFPVDRVPEIKISDCHGV